MKNEKSHFAGPGLLRRSGGWRRNGAGCRCRRSTDFLPGAYSMRWADAASFYVRSDSDWWQKAMAACPDRHRILLMAAAFVGECYRKHRRLRGEWVRCDVSDCPERAGCPCWRVYFAYDRTTDCIFNDFLSRKGTGLNAGGRLRRPAEANERKKENE